VQLHVTAADELDEEVGALSEAVVRLKGMATRIGEEAHETGVVQDAIAKGLEQAQAGVRVGVRKMKKMHREMWTTCGPMMALVAYAVGLIVCVIFLARVRTILSWIF
jgi:hypothetical protein